MPERRYIHGYEMAGYNHKEVEEKWQKRWADAQAFRADDASPKEKKYILDMYPYPSGAGLHVGHVEGYTATDIYSRYLRMKGYEVLHPMGWDAFGLPAENYAVKTKVPPAVTTEAAIKTFIEQINSLGLSYDWSREVGSHRPDYYKWTQWLFGLLYKNDLAYKQKAKVNWCPKDQTVLANEQVVNGLCERCGDTVIQKDLEQWFFRITKYVDELIAGLDTIDWPESTKAAQRNWIGKNSGVRYQLSVKDIDRSVETYSTHFEAFYADTFAVIAPDHKLLPELVAGLPEAEHILARAKEILDVRERAAYGANTEPDGVFTGRYLLDPITNTELPLWVANYALAEYGTGIIKCSAHDQRDFAFAKKYGLPLRVVLKPDDASLVERVNALDVCFSDFDRATLLFPPEFEGTRPHEERTRILTYLEAKGYGVPSTQYRLRDWLISRQRYWGAPIPVVYDPDGKPHLVPEEHLPWLLPTDVEFMPTGESPIAKSKELVERTERIFGHGWRPEVDTMDTFVCSSWYFFRFADPNNAAVFADAEKIKRWLPVDLYMGGAEHTVLHLLYARFFTKVLKDFGYITFDEPFMKLRHQGTILAEDGRKMSKSLGNVINPTEVIEEYGADSLRLYEMFMGPLEVAKPWNTRNILGVRRFLERVQTLSTKVEDAPLSPATDTLLHQSIAKVTTDIESFGFNTAISQLMILSNHLAELPTVPKHAFEGLLMLLAPLAPHLSHELWEALGHAEPISTVVWPVADQTKLKASVVTVGVQVNGKVRGAIVISPDAPQEEVLVQARADESVAKWLSGKREVKAVYVPGRIVSFVVEG